MEMKNINIGQKIKFNQENGAENDVVEVKKW